MMKKIGLLSIALLVTFSLSMANPHPVDAKKGGYSSTRKSYTPKDQPSNNVTKNQSNTSTNKSNTTTQTPNKGGFFNGGLMKGLFIGGLAGLLFGGLFGNMGFVGSILGLLVNVLAIILIIVLIRKIFSLFRQNRNMNNRRKYE
ncbi:hypothetical protein [Paenibacillus larvae]|uniref:Preprotein translocase subunit Tim44 n=1 Tax=Paenibacillus larvae subsp. larvae DSM 25430 TaxID=697284 RepID=V9W667_9BACL|nr:hypothetical protein [Paenibacillus larvae]AHD06516.1 hypothetical protein ERIC2_c27310 [Paenibacillus larvae subsp. larvae DSM 25430]AVG13073.1 hypothetical protein ERICII_02719 [Paenibacillus larvae subsp. larvae DSM 25430]MDR5568946.1 hypothetical protein [Paenibacillus larvae]MDR5596777.1 hypothetical protein [Paenibacillus larvae]